VRGAKEKRGKEESVSVKAGKEKKGRPQHSNGGLAPIKSKRIGTKTEKKQLKRK